MCKRKELNRKKLVERLTKDFSIRGYHGRVTKITRRGIRVDDWPIHYDRMWNLHMKIKTTLDITEDEKRR